MRIASVASILFAAFLSGQVNASCPTEFLAFVSRFEDSPAFQRQHTRFPLPASFIDSSGAGEPKEVGYVIESHADPKYKRIAWPTRAKQASVPFERRIGHEPGGIETVTFSKPDTDYQFTFYFRRSGECWALIKFEDSSL